jgi:hypothetical protein
VPVDDVSARRGSPVGKDRQSINKTSTESFYYSDDVDVIVGNFDDFRSLSTLEHSAPALDELIQQSNQKSREILEELLPAALRHFWLITSTIRTDNDTASSLIEIQFENTDTILRLDPIDRRTKLASSE